MKAIMIGFGLLAGAALVAVPAARAQCGAGGPGAGCCARPYNNYGHYPPGYAAPARVPPTLVPEPAPSAQDPGQSANPQSAAPLAAPVEAVLDNYLSIQASLASDSLQGLPQSASTIAQSVQNDSAKALPTNVAKQAGSLAKARDLESARAAFKGLSESMIKYVKANNITGLHEAYCPMARASWLQAGEQINNPYMGRSMPGCGQFKS